MSNPTPSIFSRIIAREIPADIVFESDAIIGFRDIAPKAPIHILIVPKTEAYRNVTELAAGDPALLATMAETAQAIADQLCGGEFRLVFNTGARVGQTVFHVHAHLLGSTATESLTEGSLAD